VFAVILRPFRHGWPVALTLVISSVAWVQAENQRTSEVSFEIAPVPAWVKPFKPDGDLEVGADDAGMVYLLSDQQENLERSAFYYHEVRKITSEAGIKNGASISASFDPAFEKLIFHSIKHTRGGTVSDQLHRSRFKLFQKEEDPEQLVYDPSWTAKITLENLRVGDVIEFAFTKEGANPLRRGKYSKIHLAQAGVLIARNLLRLVYSASRILSFRSENGAREPSITTFNGTTELWYEDHNVPGRTIEDDASDDYEPRQLLDISEFRNWADVTNWAIPLFEVEPARSPEFNAEIEKLRGLSDPEERVVAALQFVQDEIHYVKLATRLDARPLTAPDEVLRRRFANYWDKALLLVKLLRGIDIDAAPALVSGSFRGRVHEFLPSSDTLDHVLVQVRLPQGTYWLNAAGNAQRGPLSQVYVRPYGYALVLRPGTTELTPFQAPRGSFPVRKVVENYRVPPPDKVAELEVISEYWGFAADRTRAFFRENTREEIQKHYLEFYTRTFPDAKGQKLPWYEELPGENACRVTESYIIPRMWQLNDERDRYFLSFRPTEIYSALGSTISPERNDPLKLEYPNTVTEELNVQMFEDWPLDAKSENRDTKFFRVHDKPSGSGSALQFHYSYNALKDRVEVSEFVEFNEVISKAKDTLAYTLRYRTPEQLKNIERLGTFNWAVGAAAFCFFGSAGFFAYGSFRKSKLPQSNPPPIDAPARLNGISGWLILLAIGQTLLPVRFIKTLFDVFPTAIHTNSWRALTDPIEPSYHAWWAPTLLFELFFNIGGFLFAVLLAVLFFTKKAVWPRAFALFLVVNFVGAVVDTILVDHIPDAAEPVLASLRDIAPIALTGAIWIPYVFLSKRVKATFRY
jgi:transglutaminase-like putative cysteine protease